jgi:enoyl-CoA hydratase/carnithine racemase
MTDQGFVLRELDEDGVLLATLNRPEKKNAFHDPQWDALADCLDDARQDPAVAVVVLTGAGGNFSSGVDLPLLAAVQGVAVGGGCTLAVAADIVYVGDGLRMRLPFANLGLVPEIASSYTLQAAIGRQRAAELMFTAEWIDAHRAVEMGLAARRYPDDRVLEQTLAKAREIAQWPVSALRGIKQTLQAPHRQGIEAARRVEDEAMMQLAGSPENIEAVKAFLEKREPDFKQFRKK